jgi:hypothetical protein
MQPLLRRPFGSLAELDAERLECLRICWHRELAVAAAIHYCTTHRLPAPQWLIDEAGNVLFSLLRHVKQEKRGRASGAVARYRQDMIDYARWDAVREVREKQIEVRKQVDELRSNPSVPKALLEEREKMLFWVGRHWLRAYECAAMVLRGTNAAAGPDAMKASYLRVTRNNQDPSQSLRYHLFDPIVMSRLGIRDVLKPTRSRRVRPLFELTL